jgi:DNA-binding MarR family transcriptional regulator
LKEWSVSTGDVARPDPDTPTLIARTHFLASRRVGDAVADAGFRVKASHGAVFSQLGQEGARLTDLARGAQMSPQAMGELVDELEGLGYVVRTPDPGDRRAKLIMLTDAGRSCSEAGRDAVVTFERELSDILGARGHQQLRRMLLRLLQQG